MPSFDELSKQYAERIRAAARLDGNISYTLSNITKSYLLQTLKSIKNEIDSLVYESSTRPLSIEDKNRILRDISVKLNASAYRQLSEHILIKAASNDGLSDLIDIVNQILR